MTYFLLRNLVVGIRQYFFELFTFVDTFMRISNVFTINRLALKTKKKRLLQCCHRIFWTFFFCYQNWSNNTKKPPNWRLNWRSQSNRSVGSAIKLSNGFQFTEVSKNREQSISGQIRTRIFHNWEQRFWTPKKWTFFFINRHLSWTLC